MLGKLGRRATLDGHLPQLKRFTVALGSEIEPFAVARPAGREIIGAGEGWQETRDSARHLDNIDFAPLFGMKFKGDVASVGRPACPSSRSVQGSDLVAIGTIGGTRPNIPEA